MVWYTPAGSKRYPKGVCERSLHHGIHRKKALLLLQHRRTCGGRGFPRRCTGRCPSCCRHKDRSPEEYKALVNRLSRIEGQVRGVRGMLEKDAYCVDILVQVAAVNSALNSFAKELLAQHMSTCVADDLRAGSDEKLNELIKLLPRLMK